MGQVPDRAILGNPRDTGFEAWNKQRKDEVLVDVEDVALGHVTKMRWNDSEAWITSAEPTHEPLVSRELFDAAQAMFDRNKRAATRTPRAGRHYVLAGRIRCGACGRRMQGHWSHDRAYYRCKFTEDYPDGDSRHPRNIYVKEDSLLPGLDRWLASLFDDDHIDHTCDRLAGICEPDPATQEREAALRAAVADCDRKLANYRALLDHEDAVDRRRLVDRRHPKRTQEPRTPTRPIRPRRPTHLRPGQGSGEGAQGHRQCARRRRAGRQESSCTTSSASHSPTTPPEPSPSSHDPVGYKCVSEGGLRRADLGLSPKLAQDLPPYRALLRPLRALA